MRGLSRNRGPKDQQFIAGMGRQEISRALPEIGKVAQAYGAGPQVDRGMDRVFEGPSNEPA